MLGAEYLSAGIVKGAALSSDLIHKGASKARQKINPEDKPVVVDPRVKEGLRIAREASGVALKATGFLGDTFILIICAQFFFLNVKKNLHLNQSNNCF